METDLMATPAAAPVDPQAIRLEWREAREGAPSTATMNFVVYVENERYRDWVIERAQRIVDKHPSRMIVMDAVKGAHAVRVIAGRVESEGPPLYRERVDIGVDGVRAADRLHLVESLFTTGVPVVVWWAADRLFESNTFKAFLPVAQHVILDSSGTGTEPTAIREFASFFAEDHDVALRDLAWMRLDPWRDVVAQFFDDPGLRDELFAIRKIEVASGSESEALYLGCWLSSRLGWTICDACTYCDANGVMIPFERKREGEIRRVQSIKLTTETSVYSAYVSGTDAVALEVEGKHHHPIRHVPLQAIDNTSLVERAILDASPDEVFIEALHCVGELLKER
ncbi:MAG: glucose-6-phosphate dehydrogenase assembly protein OpcA [Candidatus Eremiobacteraeota bacterium]|nr:glucose-6-phosphate dehydrogenase assembly protein OpcA [Candidatus Eremiobacteraeota bacterium]